MTIISKFPLKDMYYYYYLEQETHMMTTAIKYFSVLAQRSIENMKTPREKKVF